MKKFVCLIILILATVEGFPASLRARFSTTNDKNDDEKHFPIDDYGKNLLIESQANKNFLFPEALQSVMQERLHKRFNDYAVKTKSLIPDDVYFTQFVPINKKNFENNPFESYYEGLKAQDDNNNGRDNNDDDIDEGLWLNTSIRPHYEVPGMRRSRVDNIAKRFKARQQAEQNYFYY